MHQPQIIKPVCLQKGQTVGIVAPAGCFDAKQLQHTVNNIEQMGLLPDTSALPQKQNGYLAGSDHQRAEALHHFFSQPDTAAIWCLRGGYGSARLLPLLNFDAIKKHPKIFAGYSDITVLLNAFFQKTGLVTFHSPMGINAMNPFSQTHFLRALSTDKPVLLRAAENTGFVITHGTATGPVAGGNLSVMVSLLGTPYETDMAGKILLIEEVGEEPYRIDRMLTQLLLSGRLQQAAAIVLGIFSSCEAETPARSRPLKAVLHERLAPLGIPVMYGFPFGHIAETATLPVGLTATFNTQAGTLQYHESAVICPAGA